MYNRNLTTEQIIEKFTKAGFTIEPTDDTKFKREYRGMILTDHEQYGIKIFFNHQFAYRYYSNKNLI
jgi:hypothetical protein